MKRKTIMRLTAVLLLTAIPLQLFAKKVSDNEKHLMNQIAVNCSETPILYKPESVVNNNKVAEFNDSVRWVTRDIKELMKTSPEADKSEHKIMGKPFKEHIARCIDVFNKNQAALEQRANNQPKNEAVSKIESALFNCKVITKNSSSGDMDETSRIFAEFPEFYAEYISNRDAAYALDEKVKQWKTNEIASCDHKVQVLKRQYDKEQAAIIAKATQEKEARKAKELAKEKERQRQIAEQKKREKKHLEAKTKKAKALGFRAYQAGLVKIIDLLNSGRLSLEEARSYLIETTSSDKFKFQSLINDYVVYAYTKDSFDVVQVALERKSGKFYGEGSELSHGLYRIKDTEEFTTLLGSRRQILVLGNVE